MKYETRGGEIKSTADDKYVLRQLAVGDKFTNTPRTGLWLVLSDCRYNAGAGTPTRLCEDLKTGERCNKQCRMPVIPVK